jgi:hypothetical protein
MSDLSNIVHRKVLVALTCIVLMAGCASFEKQSSLEPVPEISPGILNGYLPVEALPNSLALRTYP